MPAFDRFALGLLASLFVHGCLVIGVHAVWVADSAQEGTPPDEAVQLDLTQVDLSFVEEENEAVAPQIANPAAVEREPPSPPPPRAAPPEPPPLVAPDGSDAVPVRPVDDVRPTDLRPSELDAPETPRTETKPPTNKERPAEPEPPTREQSVPPPPVPAPVQARVEAPPAPRRAIRPKYPEGARKRGEQGDVTLELAVDAHGVVVGVTVVASCGFAELEQAAVAAARRASFKPARRDGKPVASSARLTLTFRLRE